MFLCPNGHPSENWHGGEACHRRFWCSSTQQSGKTRMAQAAVAEPFIHAKRFFMRLICILAACSFKSNQMQRTAAKQEPHELISNQKYSFRRRHDVHLHVAQVREIQNANKRTRYCFVHFFPLLFVSFAHPCAPCKPTMPGTGPNWEYTR